jgi:putative FmdB family regulatory protein
LPIYEYECESCANVTDIKHGFKETHSEVCPKCGGRLKRVFNAAGIVFKGSGFYVNDSRKSTSGAVTSGNVKSGDAKSGEAASGEAKSGETKTEKAGDSKPADTGPKSDGGGKSDAAA